MSNVITIDVDKEFAQIKLARMEARDRWTVLQSECPVRIEGEVSLVPWSELSRCCSGVYNLDGDRNSMAYCLYPCCPKIM